MKKVPKRSALVLTGILALGLLPSMAGAAVSSSPAPGQPTQQWYLQYMQQYSGSPISQPPTTQPVPPSSPPANPQPEGPANSSPALPTPTPVPSQPGNSQDPQQWYLEYLRQYQAPSQPVSTQPTQTVPPEQPGEQPATPPVEMPQPEGLTAEEAQLLQWVNQERAKAGKAPVKIDLQLVRLARLKAQDLATNNYFGHTSPTYGTPGQMLTQAGYRWAAVGETLAKAGSITKAHAMLMASSSHRNIILSDKYTNLGIGVVQNQRGPGLLVVELFTRLY